MITTVLVRIFDNLGSDFQLAESSEDELQEEPRSGEVEDLVVE